MTSNTRIRLKNSIVILRQLRRLAGVKAGQSFLFASGTSSADLAADMKDRVPRMVKAAHNAAFSFIRALRDVMGGEYYYLESEFKSLVLGVNAALSDDGTINLGPFRDGSRMNVSALRLDDRGAYGVGKYLRTLERFATLALSMLGDDLPLSFYRETAVAITHEISSLRDQIDSLEYGVPHTAAGGVSLYRAFKQRLDAFIQDAKRSTIQLMDDVFDVAREYVDAKKGDHQYDDLVSTKVEVDSWALKLFGNDGTIDLSAISPEAMDAMKELSKLTGDKVDTEGYYTKVVSLAYLLDKLQNVDSNEESDATQQQMVKHAIRVAKEIKDFSSQVKGIKDGKRGVSASFRQEKRAGKRMFGTDGEKASFEGSIYSQEKFRGSKSSHKAPVLVLDDLSVVHVYILGDSAFDPTLLTRYVNKRVRVSGIWRKGTLRVRPQDIQEVEQEIVMRSNPTAATPPKAGRGSILTNTRDRLKAKGLNFRL